MGVVAWRGKTMKMRMRRRVGMRRMLKKRRRMHAVSWAAVAGENSSEPIQKPLEVGRSKRTTTKTKPLQRTQTPKYAAALVA